MNYKLSYAIQIANCAMIISLACSVVWAVKQVEKSQLVVERTFDMLGHCIDERIVLDGA